MFLQLPCIAVEGRKFFLSLTQSALKAFVIIDMSIAKRLQIDIIKVKNGIVVKR